MTAPTYWQKVDAHRVATECSHRHIQSLLERAKTDIELLLHHLHTALPFVEDAKADACYKPGAAARVEAGIRTAIKAVERLS